MKHEHRPQTEPPRPIPSPASGALGSYGVRSGACGPARHARRCTDPLNGTAPPPRLPLSWDGVAAVERRAPSGWPGTWGPRPGPSGPRSGATSTPALRAWPGRCRRRRRRTDPMSSSGRRLRADDAPWPGPARARAVHVVESASGSPTRLPATCARPGSDAAERDADEAVTAGVAELRRYTCRRGLGPGPGPSAGQRCRCRGRGRTAAPFGLKKLREEHERVIRRGTGRGPRATLDRQPARGSAAREPRRGTSPSRERTPGRRSRLLPWLSPGRSAGHERDQPGTASGRTRYRAAPHAAPVRRRSDGARPGPPYPTETATAGSPITKTASPAATTRTTNSDDEEYDEEPEAPGPLTEARERRGSNRAWSLTQIGKDYVAEEGRTS